MADLVVFEGRQYPADRLPEGVDLKDTMPIAEWFATNRVAEHKAVLAPEKKPAGKAKAK